jgi:predicted phage baseplate assembly protein
MLPVPTLDDRHFQQFVDDAKRLVQNRCPEWTDHNVSDPGVTLIEAFAQMTDHLVYRLNRIPDRMYVKFLELLGVELRAGRAARVPVTFWLSAATDDRAVVVPQYTVVATKRTPTQDAITFSTEDELTIAPCTFFRCGTSNASSSFTDTTDTLAFGQGFLAFSTPPTPGDALLIGLSNAVPSAAVALTMAYEIEGIGVDPDDPPLVWEAWTGKGWQPCEIERDLTGALNRPGDIVLHVPDGHIAHVLGGRRAGWLRARVLPADASRLGRYTHSPRVKSLAAATIGGTTTVVHAQPVTNERLGVANGAPGQRYPLARTPVLVDIEPLKVEVAEAGPLELPTNSGNGAAAPDNGWKVVTSFIGSTEHDAHALIDHGAGEIVFGPAIREPDGTVRQYGRVPAAGSTVSVARYWIGGGRRGNVAPHAIEVLKTTVPFVARVDNRRAAVGGVDAETVDGAKLRGPIVLRSRGRAVTADDYEAIALEAAPDAARIHCSARDREFGVIRVMVVPQVRENPLGDFAFADLVPSVEMMERIRDALERTRCLGARVLVEPVRYLGVTVVADVQVAAHADPARVREDALRALNGYFHPIRGGADGQGWPFGRSVHLGDVYAALQPVPGCTGVEDVELRGTDPRRRLKGPAVPRVDVEPDTLVCSVDHQVRAER